MSSFFHTVKNPAYGMSSIPDIARPEGFCENQINWFNDPTRGITRRNSSRAVGSRSTLPNVVGILKIETFQAELAHITYVIVELATGNIGVLKWDADGVSDELLYDGLPIGWSSAHDYRMFLIDKKLYVVNTSISVQVASSVKDVSSFGVSNIVIPQALGYSEKVSARVLWRTKEGVDTVLLDWVSYTTVAYNGDNQAAADASRARDKVTSELVTRLSTTYTSPFSGNSEEFKVVSRAGAIDLLLSEADLAHNLLMAGNLIVEVESANMESSVTTNDSVLVFNSVISNTTGLPKYATINGVKKVQADPRDAKGAYYLRPTPINNANEKYTMYEVAWVETYAPAEYKEFVLTTLPLVIDTTTLEVSHMPLKSRPAGDDLTNKEPHFVGKRIRALYGSQERLGVVSADKVWWSRTDDKNQMWRTSAVQTLSTDAFGIGNAGATNDFEHVVPHNRALLFVSAQQQCKIDGSVPLVNGSTTMPITTSNTLDVSVKPISMGSKVYIPTRLANSTGLLEYYTSSVSDVDETRSVTDHVKGVLRGRILMLAGNDNSKVLAIRTDGTEYDELLIANINTTDPNVTVHAWSKWVFDDLHIVEAVVTEAEVRVYGYYVIGGVKYYTMLSVDIYYNPYIPRNRVCLDNQVEVTATGDSVVMQLPAGYPAGELWAVPLEGANPLVSEKVTRTGNDIEFLAEDGVKYLLGRRYESLVELSRIYRYNDNGLPILSDRLRIVHLIVHMSDVYRLARRILAKHFTVDDEWMVTENGSNMDFLYKLEPFTGEYRYGVSMNSADGNLALFTDYELSATITGLAYRANMLNR